MRRRSSWFVPCAVLVGCLVAGGIGEETHGEATVPTGMKWAPIEIDEVPIVTLKLSAEGELCGMALDPNHPLEVSAERIGESGRVAIATEVEGGRVSFDAPGTGLDDPGTVYRVIATDRYGNSSVAVLIRSSQESRRDVREELPRRRLKKWERAMDRVRRTRGGARERLR